VNHYFFHKSKLQLNSNYINVAYHKQKKYGLVCDILDSSDYGPGILPVERITALILPKTFLNLIDWLKNYYLASPSLFCNLIIPASPKRQLLLQKAENGAKKLYLSKNVAENISAILKNYKSDKNLFIYENNFKELAAVFIKLAQKGLNKQVLFLVPSPADIKLFLPYLTEYFGRQLIVWQSKMPQNERFSKWSEILSGKSCVILGTRTAVFLPFSNLAMALVYNGSSSDYKQWDSNPRYDSRKILEKLSEIHQMPIVFSDVLPNINLYNEIKEQRLLPLNLPAGRPAGFSIFDLRLEKKNNHPIFSYPLRQIIDNAASLKKQVIIFLNRREKDSVLFCKECSFVFKCPACKRPYNIDKESIFCYHCKSKRELPLSCEKCGNSRLKALMIGLDGLKKLLAKEYPSLKISAEQDVPANDADIIITADIFWRTSRASTDWPNLYGIAMADFDSYFLRPDINQRETALLALEKFLRFGKNSAAEKMLIQTSWPDNSIFSDWGKTFEEELAERKERGYPPFGRLIKIICKEKDGAGLKKRAEELYIKLKQSGYFVLPPFEPLAKKRTKNYLMHIIIKAGNNSDLGNLKKIIPLEYQIDIDPISLI